MAGPYKRKKYHVGDTHLKKRWRTKRRTKDLDQIDTDLTVGKVEKFLNQTVDYDKTGLGQFYCVHCSKDFIDGNAFKAHIKSKPHKRRLHALISALRDPGILTVTNIHNGVLSVEAIASIRRHPVFVELV